MDHGFALLTFMYGVAIVMMALAVPVTIVMLVLAFMHKTKNRLFPNRPPRQ